VRLEHVAEQRQGLFGLRRRRLDRLGGGLALDEVAAFAAAEVHVSGGFQLLDKVRKTAATVSLLAEGGVQLQHGGLEQPSCGCTPRRSSTASARSTSGMARGDVERRRFAARGTLRRLLLGRLLLRLLLLPVRLLRFVEQRLVTDDLVAVLLEDGAGEGLAAQHEDGLAEFPELVDQGNKIAVAADDGERVDVVVSERHFQGVQGEIDVGAILVAARRGNALHHLDGVGRHLARRAFLPGPVRVSELGDDVAALFERVERHRDVEFTLKRGLDADFDVVVIDKHRDIQLVLHVFLVVPSGICMPAPQGRGQSARHPVPL
jgi:hypothetical protein